MTTGSIVKAWVILAVLSLCTTVLTLLPAAGSAQRILVAASLLGLAGTKARVILSDYLGLKASRFWSRTFDLTLGLFLVTAFAIYSFASRT